VNISIKNISNTFSLLKFQESICNSTCFLFFYIILRSYISLWRTKF